ncbi:MAG: NAD(P)/FAD-dependent oxidoreductase [Gammaproteobacteria bacterium]
MPQHDVLIVGGGPSGSTLAWALRQQGMDVAIIDKQAFPRDKVCAGWITPAVLASLKIDVDDYQRHNLLQPIHGFRVGRISGGMKDIDYPDGPVSYAIRRCEFDHYLLKRSGATLYTETKVASLQQVAHQWILNGDYSAPLLVGAGGHFCPVARHLGAKLGKAEIAVTAQEIEFAMSATQAAACPVVADTPELFFCDDLQGYGWVVRKQDYLNIGLGRTDNHRLSEHVEAFVAQLKSQGRIPQDTPAQFHGHAYLCYPQAVRQLAADGVLLIGDAAGLAYPESGEGIRPAIESAILAAGVIRNSAPSYRQAQLAAYPALVQQRFGQRATALSAQVGGNVLINQARIAIGKALLASHWFSRHVVVNRWFLHQQQPPLLLQEGTA